MSGPRRDPWIWLARLFSPRARRYAPPYQEPLRYGSDQRRRRGRDLDDGGVPVEPNKPSNLEGGAAAALEFDD